MIECIGSKRIIVSTNSSISTANHHKAIAITPPITRSVKKPNHLVFGFILEKLAVKEYLKITSNTEAPRIKGLIISGGKGPNRGIIQ
jgi:hypothetical protein